MENKAIETVGTMTNDVVKAAAKTVTTGQLVALGAGCAAGGAAAGIGGYIGIKALIKRHKEKKAAKKEKAEEPKKETPAEEKKEETKSE